MATKEKKVKPDVAESQSMLSIRGAGYRMAPDLKALLMLNPKNFFGTGGKKHFVNADKFALAHVKKRATARDLGNSGNGGED